MVKNDDAIFLLWENLKIFRLNLKFMLTVFLMTFTLSASGYSENKADPPGATQQITVSGVVTDRATNEPLPGTSIIVSGTTIGTVTDVDGRYSLQVPSGDVTLQFSFVGYITRNIELGGRTELNVMLEQDVALLSEVVVVGYGTMRRADLTGAVTSVTEERLLDRPTVNLGEAIAGKLTGVHVQRAAAGEPGGGYQIRIRGISSVNTGLEPLFVVDGIVGVANALDNLNPNDIKSIDVLKDASATAIYGARGANGVIVIETRRGEVGRTQVQYRAAGTLNTLHRKTDALNSEQIMYVYEQALANTTKYGRTVPAKDFRGAPGKTSQSYSEMPWIFKPVGPNDYRVNLIGNDGNYYAPIYDSNWEDIFYNNSITNNHYLDIRGGTENSRFSISAGFNDDQGLQPDSFFRRYNARLTGDVNVTDRLRISSSLSYLNSESNPSPAQRHTVEVWSLVPVKYPDDPELGIYANRWGTNSDFNVGEQWMNPMFVTDQVHGRYLRDVVMGSAIVNYDLTENLTFTSDFSIDMSYGKNNYYSGTYFNSNPTAQISTSTSKYWQNQNYLNYRNTFGASHNVGAMVGLSWSERTGENAGLSNREFFTDFYRWSNMGAGGAARPGVSSSDWRSALNSYFGRLNYDYQGKYLLTVTGRIDGSSRFGVDNKYAFFPSVGVAWRISQEDFFNVGFITNLKLRGSWGQTGNQEIGNYQTQARVSTTSVILGGAARTGLVPTTMGNSGLRWETITQWDVGFDIGVFDNRFQIMFDVYERVTDDMLLSVPLPNSTTTGSVTMNYGSLKNYGWELEFHSRNIRASNFEWNSGVTLYSNQNEILQLGPTNAPIYRNVGAGRGANIIRAGDPIGSFFGLTRLGTWGTHEAAEAARYGLVPGDLKFLDRNNDGKIDMLSDGDVIGNSWPKLLIGFNNTFRFGNFDAILEFQAVYGVDKVFIHESAEDRQLVSGGLNTVLQAWRPDNQDAMVAQIRPGYGGAYYQSFMDTHAVYDGSFIRGTNATLGYTFRNLALGINQLRVYLSAHNWLLLTGAKGYDPEGSALGGQELQTIVANIDKYQVPRAAQYSLGVSVNF